MSGPTINSVMKVFSSEDREALGLSPSMECIVVKHDKAPQKPTCARDKSETLDVGPDMKKLAAQIANKPEFVPVAFEFDDLDARFSRWASDPCVLIIHFSHQRTSKSSLLSGFFIWLNELSVAFDSRSRCAHARFEGERHDWLVQLDSGDLTLFELWNSAGEKNDEVNRRMDSSEVPVPDIASWLAHQKTSPWLEQTATKMANSSRSLTRAAAAGLIARLWHLADRSSRNAIWDQLRSGHETPANKASTWFRSITKEARDSVEHSALLEADILEKRLSRLEQMALDEPEEASKLGCAWLHRRDDLECILFLLRRTNEGDELNKALTMLDAHASNYKSFWHWLEPRDDERLLAVSWREPHAWWGQVALDSIDDQ
jgi:hypothetical protein